jgi:hypothetical protein
MRRATGSVGMHVDLKLECCGHFVLSGKKPKGSFVHHFVGFEEFSPHEINA